MMKRPGFSLILVFCVMEVLAAHRVYAQSVTLYLPHNKVIGKYDETRACFSFQRGATKTSLQRDWDIGYGLAGLAGEDYIQVSAGNDERSVMKDLGEFDWADSFKIPVLTPLPEMEKGKNRVIKIDSLGPTGQQWEKSAGIFAKAVVGHMYLVHIKTGRADFYALFRIESLEQGKQCAISWRLISSPEEK